MGEKRRGMGAAAFCFAVSAVLLLICSMNSYLYPLNPWVDVNCYVTVGREMLKGMVPYRDLVEQKGPLLYALHALFQMISPGSYHGIYWMETLLLTGTLMCFWKIARLCMERISTAWVVLPAAVLLASRAFCMGDSAEEMCLMPVALSMYELLRVRGRARELSVGRFVLNGMAAGCILWIKYSLLGFHFVWMAYLAIETLVDDRSLSRAIGICAAFLLGMFLSSVPWLIYFGVRGALGDLVDVYFVNTIANYGKPGRGVLDNTARALIRCARSNPAFVLTLICSGVCALISRAIPRRCKVFLLLSAAGTSLGAFCRGAHGYYCVILAAFLPFCMLLPEWICERLGMKAGLRRWMAGAALVCGAACVFAASPNARYAGYPYERTVQGQAAARVKRFKGDELLNVGGLDAGFYFCLDMRPADRWFCWLNLDPRECIQSQTACLKSRKPRYVVTNVDSLKEYGMPDTYEAAYVFESDYAADLNVLTKVYVLERKEHEG